ncbi:MAG: hypothetical protein SPJ55_06760 [Treponema sp.]|nr:hypothetical protein [Treponema sp.]
MKKNILLSVLTCIFVMSFTGCLFVGVDLNERHTMTFSNESKYYVTDWYVKDSDGNNYVKSHDYFYPVAQNSANSIHNIPTGSYTVYFSFEENPGKRDYWKSSSDIYLCKDRTYYLYNYCYNSVSDEFSRKITDDNSITSPVNDEKTQVIYLQDETGNVIEFVKAQED